MEIKFQASYLLNHREFNVLVKFGSRRLFEKMTISKFMRFARQTDKPLVVQGMTIVFDSETTEAEDAIRKYLKKVADSYLAYKGSLN